MNHNADVIVIVHIKSTELFLRLVFQGNNRILFQLGIGIFCRIGVNCSAGPLVGVLADAVDGLAVDLRLYIIVDHFVGAAGALNTLNLGDLILQRRFGQVDLGIKFREIFSFVFADDVVFFIDNLVGQFYRRCVEVIVQRDRGVFFHLGLFTVGDHIIRNSLLVELVDDFFLLRSGSFGRGITFRGSFIYAFRCAFRCFCFFGGSFCADLNDLTGSFDFFLGLFADLGYLRLADRCFIINISFNLVNILSSEFIRSFLAGQGN